jgi:hypothetical protein
MTQTTTTDEITISIAQVRAIADLLSECHDDFRPSVKIEGTNINGGSTVAVQLSERPDATVFLVAEDGQRQMLR